MTRRASATSPQRLVGLLGVALLLVPALVGAQQGQETYLAFGDSITSGTGETDPNETGYPSRLQSLLRQAGMSGARVENHGEAGETTLEGLGRINSVLSRGGDYILIMEGTNDINMDVSTGSILFNLERMVARAEAARVIPIWASVIPVRPSALTEQDLELAVDMRQRSLRQSIDLVDCYAAFDYFPDAWPDLYNLNLKADPVGHPNGDGYDVLAQAFADLLLGSDTQPPVVGDVQPVRGSKEVPATQEISVMVFDHGEGIDTNATTMLIDGQPVQAHRLRQPLDLHLQPAAAVEWWCPGGDGPRRPSHSIQPDSGDRHHIRHRGQQLLPRRRHQRRSMATTWYSSPSASAPVRATDATVPSTISTMTASSAAAISPSWRRTSAKSRRRIYSEAAARSIRRTTSGGSSTGSGTISKQSRTRDGRSPGGCRT